jgi:hypothetical protein
MVDQPVNYSIQYQDPFARSIQGFQMGRELATAAKEMRMAPELEAQAAAEKLYQQRAAIAKRQELTNFVQNKNATASDYLRVLATNPELKEPLKQGWEAMGAARKEALFGEGLQVLSALEGGQPELAGQLLAKRAEASRNSGDVDQAKIFDTYSKLSSVNPAALKQIIGLNLAAGDADKFAANYKLMAETEETRAKQSKLVAETTGIVADSAIKAAEAVYAPTLAALKVTGAKVDIAKKNAEIQNFASEIQDRANRFRLDTQRLATDTANVISQINERQGKLSDGVLKIVNEAALNGATAQQQSTNNIELANKIAGANLTGVRTFGQLGETFRRQFGIDITTKALRGEIERARNSAAVASLPPGTSSDRDISLFLGPIPDSFSNPAELQSYFRGLAKAQAITGAVETARADWMAQNKGMLGGRAAQPMNVGDYSVKKGQSFADLSKGIAVAVTRKMAETAKAPDVAPTQSGTMPSRSDVLSRADSILLRGNM